jgi:uncharacterized repeat protein (TIGR03803 family)
MIDLNHSRNLAVRRRAGYSRDLFLLPMLITGLGLMMLAGRLAAQTFTTLHSFTGGDGDTPYTVLVTDSSGNTLYGTARGGGGSGNGTVFKVNIDGTGFTVLHSFTAFNGNDVTNSDGANPSAGLILSGNTLYGTARGGGSSGNGTVFALNTDGTGFRSLHNFTAFIGNGFTNSEGAYPTAGLLLSGNALYATAARGGSSGWGTVFKVNTNGTGFTDLYSFNDGSDGGVPAAGLLLSGSTLYGTASGSDGFSGGTVFKVNTNGADFTTLHDFFEGGPQAAPSAGLLLSGSTLYGTSLSGGDWGAGTLFAVDTDSTGFTNLHTFTAVSINSTGVYTNSDGANLHAELLLSGNTLYGTARGGGSSGNGTVFKVNIDSTGFSTLYSFTATGTNSSGVYTNSDGANPDAGLILLGDMLYGTASGGGGSGKGTVFSLSFTPQLTITPSGANVVLTWPTNVAGFDYSGYILQSTTNLVPAGAWNTVSPAPVVVNGQNTVTNPISGTQMFFRLSQ